MRVEIEQEVLDFVRSLPPEPRSAIRRALRQLGEWRGDIRPLEGELEGFYRLRVQRYRIIFFQHGTGKRRTIRCVYAGPRSLIYEVFAHYVVDLLRQP